MFTCTKCKRAKPDTSMIGRDPGSGIEGVCAGCWREYDLSFDSYTALLTIHGHSKAHGGSRIKISGPYKVAQEVNLIELLTFLAERVVPRFDASLSLMSLRQALEEAQNND